jgi:hypothetical protein
LGNAIDPQSYGRDKLDEAFANNWLWDTQPTRRFAD